jgi:hypothetical protein
MVVQVAVLATMVYVCAWFLCMSCTLERVLLLQDRDKVELMHSDHSARAL